MGYVTYASLIVQCIKYMYISEMNCFNIPVVYLRRVYREHSSEAGRIEKGFEVRKTFDRMGIRGKYYR